MKLTITTLLLLISTISFAQIPSYVPSNGLVGWWPFNGNANDESGNGNNGTVNGATLTVDRFGVADKAYSFDGNTVTIPLTQQMVNMSNRTISFWFKTTGPQSGGRFFEATNYSWGAASYNSNLFDCWFNKSNIAYNAVGLSYPNHNSWYNIVYVCDSINSSVRVYLNGVNVHTSISVSNPGNPIDWQNHFLRLGQGNANESFGGDLDDFGIWDRALNLCEIQQLYTLQINSTTIYAGPDQTICRGDLVTLQGAGVGSLAWDNGVIDGVPFEPAQSGAYVLTGADSLGCIGTDTVQVTVLENASSTINQTAIDSYTLNGQTYTQSGTYTQVVPAANGCDSVITLNLELDFTGIQSHTNTSLQLYPNPVKDVMTLVGLKGEAVSFAVYSVDGKLIKSGQTSGEIQLEDLKKGNYILKIENQALPFVKL
jgi:hypothetical protein